MTYNINMKQKLKVGRPTMYTVDTLKEVDRYLKSCKDVTLKNGKTEVHLPKVEGLAVFIGVHKDTLYEWAKIHEEFSDALERVKNEQFIRLIDQGLSGNYNPTIAKLLLSNIHGLRDDRKEVLVQNGFSLAELFTGGVMNEDR